MNEFIQMVLDNTMTAAICLLTLVVFFGFVIGLIKIGVFSGKLRRVKNVDGVKSEKHLKNIYKKYEATIIFPDRENNMKTDEEAELYFRMDSVLSSIRVNYRLLNAGSGLMVGLGLLGTFLGLTLGVMDFDSSNTDAIQTSINGLLNGMGTAFATSLVGMACSLVFIFLEKLIVNGLQKNINSVCEILDNVYFISQPEKYVLLHQRQNDDLVNLFSSKDDRGNDLRPGNMLREILAECQKQCEYLSGLSEEVIFNQANKAMKESIAPLVAQVKQVSEDLGGKLDSFAKSVQSPGDDMVNGVVKDLKDAIKQMTDELTNTLNGSMTGKIMGLETAVQSLATFPNQIEAMTQKMTENFGNIEQLVNRLASSTASTNDDIIKSVKEQIGLATTNMNNLTAGLQATMSKIDEQYSTSSTAATKQLQSVVDSMQKTINDMNEKSVSANDMIIKKQNITNDRTSELMKELGTSISNVKAMLEEVKNTMEQMKGLQIEANTATSHLSAVADSASKMTSSLGTAQQQLVMTSNAGAENLKKLNEALNVSKQLPLLYVNSFGEIKESLKVIFDELTKGLTRYSEAVKDNTNGILESYTSSVTQGIQQLSGAIDLLGGLIEELNDVRPSNNSSRR